jgi:hypothetical protein
VKSATTETHARRRSVVRLTIACDNACVFCAQDGIVTGDEAGAFDARLQAARAASDEVTFVGGEPLLDDALASRVAAARACGFRRVGIQTNARKLAPRAAELAKAGLTDVHVSIHGADAAVHDYHTGVAGSFAESTAGIAAARAASLDVVATTVLTRSNFRVVGALPRSLASRGVAAWTIEVTRAGGRAAASFDRVVPRIGLAIPFALHALAAADELSLPAWISGAPACLLGPFAARALEGEARAYGHACDSCDARSLCPGVDAEYLSRFDGDELTPRARFTRATTRADLAAMFVGVGEVAARETRHLGAEPPARARVLLPVLGKVKPARAEVPAGTAKKSGEALREIFPDLFEGVEKKMKK